MAERRKFDCNQCGLSFAAWSDGNPYYFDEAGTKRYAFHPDHEGLAKCIGCESSHVCLGCGCEFIVDSRAPTSVCPECHSGDIVDLFDLEGKSCPTCKMGHFELDQDNIAIS